MKAERGALAASSRCHDPSLRGCMQHAFAPSGLLTLAARTPAGYRALFVDEKVDSIDFDADLYCSHARSRRGSLRRNSMASATPTTACTPWRRPLSHGKAW